MGRHIKTELNSATCIELICPAVYHDVSFHLQEALQQNMRRKSLTSGDAAASDRKKSQSNGSVSNKQQRRYSSTESLTSTDELMAGMCLTSLLAPIVSIIPHKSGGITHNLIDNWYTDGSHSSEYAILQVKTPHAMPGFRFPFF